MFGLGAAEILCLDTLQCKNITPTTFYCTGLSQCLKFFLS